MRIDVQETDVIVPSRQTRQGGGQLNGYSGECNRCIIPLRSGDPMAALAALTLLTSIIGVIASLWYPSVTILTECTFYTYNTVLNACNATPSNVEAAFALVSDSQPHTRHQALQILTAVGQKPSRSVIDVIFQTLCAVVATDSVSRLRLSALDALAGELSCVPPPVQRTLFSQLVLDS